MLGQFHFRFLLSASFFAAVAVASPEILQTDVAIDKTVSMTKGDSKEYQVQIDPGFQHIWFEPTGGAVKVYYAVSYQPDAATSDGSIYVGDGVKRVILSSQTFYFTVEAKADLTLKITSSLRKCPVGEEPVPSTRVPLNCSLVVIPDPETLQTDVAIDMTVSMDLYEVKAYKVIISSGYQNIKFESTGGAVKIYYAVSYKPDTVTSDGAFNVGDGKTRRILSTRTFYFTVVARDDVTLTITSSLRNCPADEAPVPSTGVSLNCSPVYSCAGNNPCSPSVVVTDKFFYRHSDPSKFVQCTEWEQCFDMMCPSTLLWNDAIEACDHPGF